MAFPRAAALRFCTRGARRTAVRPQLWRQVAQRCYASGGHESAKAGGDTVWAVGAVAVTVPICYYLLQNAPDTSHSHGEHGDDHGKSHGEEEQPDEEPVEEPAKSEDGESQDDDQESRKPEESGSEDGDNEADTPDTSDDEGSDDDKQDGNTVKHIPDAKGGAKKRLESEKGIKQGEASKTDGDDEKSHDKAAASKPAGSKNSQSGKQEGLSNTDTKHSTDIAQDPEKSSKGDGMPETAKAKGTVDPKRPQPGK